MSSTPIITNYRHSNPKYEGKPYPREDPEVITARKALADFHISQGKTFKYAWWLAFNQYPRDYLPEGTEGTLKSPLVGAAASAPESS